MRQHGRRRARDQSDKRERHEEPPQQVPCLDVRGQTFRADRPKVPLWRAATLLGPCASSGDALARCVICHKRCTRSDTRGTTAPYQRLSVPPMNPISSQQAVTADGHGHCLVGAKASRTRRRRRVAARMARGREADAAVVRDRPGRVGRGDPIRGPNDECDHRQPQSRHRATAPDSPSRVDGVSVFGTERDHHERQSSIAALPLRVSSRSAHGPPGRTPVSNPDIRSDAVGTIGLRIPSLAQLFDVLDPAPLQERALERNAETYIVASARTYRPTEPTRLLVHFPESLRVHTIDATDAVHEHFRRTHAQGQRNFSAPLTDWRPHIRVRSMSCSSSTRRVTWIMPG